MIIVAVGLVAASYEALAIGSRDRLPTITTLMKRIPWWSRLTIVAMFAAGLADHFTTELVP